MAIFDCFENYFIVPWKADIILNHQPIVTVSIQWGHMRALMNANRF